MCLLGLSCAPTLRDLTIVEGSFPCLAQSTQRCLRPLGHGDRGEVARAHQVGQGDGIPAVGFPPLSWLVGEQRGRDAPADRVFLRQGAGEPRASRAGCPRSLKGQHDGYYERVSTRLASPIFRSTVWFLRVMLSGERHDKF